jgi:tetratricopeptide (TPR) repeat protein
VSPHLHRAIVFLEQGRSERAEPELRQALIENPHDSLAHSLLSLCLSERNQLGPATEEAHAAIAAAPDQALGHRALAVALRRRNRLDEARAAIKEAIQLNPEEADLWGELAQIELNRHDGPAALRAADQGLAIDAEHGPCTNLRAMALVKLGRRDEAAATIGAALARDPDDPVTHANQGWTLLHTGEPRKAMEHFRESLRLDPTSDWARAGIVEAMKAKNPLYRGLLSYFLWTSRLDQRVLWAVIIGTWLGVQALFHLAEAVPATRPVAIPLALFGIGAAMTTWVGRPLADLLLRFDRLGRHALSNDQRRASTLVAITLVTAVACALAALLIEGRLRNALILNTIQFGLLLIPVSAIYNCPAGWPRRTMATIAASLAAYVTLLLLGVTILYLGAGILTPLVVVGLLIPLYPWAILASAFAANALAAATVRH